MVCVPVECAASELFTFRTRETRRSTCRCPTAIILRRLVLSSIVQRTYHCAPMINLWHRPKQWSPPPQEYSKRSLQGIWHQGDPSSQCSWVPEVSPVVSVQLHAFDMGKSYLKPCPLLVQPLQGNGQG